MHIQKTVSYGFLVGCLLLAGCSSMVLDKIIIYPAYSFNQDKLWFINGFKFKTEAISGFKYSQLGALGRQLTDKVRRRLTEAGVKLAGQRIEDKAAADYILTGAIVSISMVKYDNADTRYKNSRRDRWGRAGFEPNSDKLSKISVNGRIIQASTDKLMAGFELYESTFLEGSAGIEVLLEELSSKIVDIVLDKRT